MFRKFNQKYTQKATPLKLIQTLVGRHCQDFELLIKQLSFSLAWQNKLQPTAGDKILTLSCVLLVWREDLFFHLQGLLWCCVKGSKMFQLDHCSIYVSFHFNGILLQSSLGCCSRRECKQTHLCPVCFKGFPFSAIVWGPLFLPKPEPFQKEKNSQLLIHLVQFLWKS